jgi:hypothetical protein
VTLLTAQHVGLPHLVLDRTKQRFATAKLDHMKHRQRADEYPFGRAAD